MSDLGAFVLLVMIVAVVWLFIRWSRYSKFSTPRRPSASIARAGIAASTAPQQTTTPGRVKQLLPQAVKLDPAEIADEIYLDIETQRLSYEVEGGWSNIKDFGLAVAVTWDINGQFRAWEEHEASDLIAELHKFSRIVTYNGDRFDLKVLSAYGKVRPLSAKSFDVLRHICQATGHRVALEHVVSHTLGVGKTADGIQSVKWWRQGKKDKVIEYCCHDVELLLRLVAHARETGYIVIDAKRVKVNWSPLRRPLTRAAAASRS